MRAAGAVMRSLASVAAVACALAGGGGDGEPQGDPPIDVASADEVRGVAQGRRVRMRVAVVDRVEGDNGPDAWLLRVRPLRLLEPEGNHRQWLDHEQARTRALEARERLGLSRSASQYVREPTPPSLAIERGGRGRGISR